MKSERVPLEKKRVVIYCRVASAAQLGDPGLEVQERGLRAYATARGYEIAGVVKETGSGLTLDRPGIREIYEMAGRRTMDAVLAKSISRYTRGPASEFIGFIEALADKGVTAATAQEGDLCDMLPVLGIMP